MKIIFVAFAIIILTIIDLLAFRPSVFGIHPKLAPVSEITPISTTTTPPAATPAIPADKKPSPTAKTTIKGTPAQLVKDLRAAGIDIVKGFFTKPELLTNEMPGGLNYHLYSFSNAFAAIDISSGKLQRIHLYTEDGSFLPNQATSNMPSLAIGDMDKLFGSGESFLLDKYGLTKMRNQILEKNLLVCHVLTGGKEGSIWRITFFMDSNDHLVRIDIDELCTKALYIDTQHGQGSGSVNGKRLYSDLYDAGLAPGYPSSKQSIIQAGKLSYAASGELWAKQYSLYNADIQETADGVLTSFEVYAGVETRKEYEKYPALPDNPLLDALRSGRDAVVKRYGYANDIADWRTKRTCVYHIVYDNGTSLRRLQVSFILGEDKRPDSIDCDLDEDMIFAYPVTQRHN